VHLPALLVAAGLAASSSEARRLIDGGGVKIDGAPAQPKRYDIEGQELAGRVVAVGKRKVARVTSM